MGNAYLTEMLTNAKTAYIDWLIKGDSSTSHDLANWLTKVADYLDCTESQALVKVQGHE